jgi:CobQ-like glutamine amidotransferase family enzyme
LTEHLTIVHVLPALLGSYGDVGNVLVLRHRAESRGIAVTIVDVAPGDLVPGSADLYVIGGGQGDEETRAAELLRADTGLLTAFQRGAPILAVCAGMQLLGEWFTDGSGSKIAGVGILDLVTSRRGERAVGDVLAEVTAIPGLPTLIGFENHRGATSLGPACQPLAHVQRGIGNGAGEPVDGAVQGSVIGTYLHGPVLALNPALADHLIQGVVGTLPTMDDERAEEFRARRRARALG